MVKVKKLVAASNSWGHYNRASGLCGSTPAQWGVFNHARQIFLVLKAGTFWQVYTPELDRVIPRAFTSRIAATRAAVKLAEEQIAASEKEGYRAWG
jgi:hypothetical protein